MRADLAALEPGEIIVADASCSDDRPDAGLRRSAAVASRAGRPFDSADGASAGSRLISAWRRSMALAPSRRAELSALGALLDYVELTQVGARPPSGAAAARESGRLTMIIDQATRANLELTRTLQRRARTARCSTASTAPSRRPARGFWRARLAAPLTDPDAINARLDSVGFLRRRRATCAMTCARRCSQRPDIERALSRLALGRGGPRDLAAHPRRAHGGARSIASHGLGQARSLAEELAARIAVALGTRADRRLLDQLAARAGRRPAAPARDGGFVRDGLRMPSSTKCARCATRRARSSPALQARYAAETGIKSLKIRHNNVLGYFIEVTAQNAGAA